MPASDIVAGLVGGIEGGLQGYSWLEEQKRRQQEEQARIADQRARREMEKLRLKLMQDQGARAESQALRSQVGEEMKARIPGTDVSAEDATRIRGAGLGYRLEDVPRVGSAEMLQPSKAPLSAIPFGVKTETRVRPTIAQWQEQQKEKKAEQERAALMEYINSQPEHLRPALQAGLMTGKMPTLDPGEFVAPDERSRMEEQAAVREAERESKLRVTEHGEKAAISDQYRRTAEQRAAAQKASGKGTAKTTPSIQAAMKNLEATVQQLESLDAELTQQAGFGGKLAGGWQAAWAAATGTDEPATIYGALGETLVPALARAAGEVGNLAQREQERYQKLIPRVTDPVNIRRAKLDAIKQRIALVEAGASGEELTAAQDTFEQQIGERSTTPGRGSGMDNDPLGIR